jgi:hypothetical protein
VSPSHSKGGETPKYKAAIDPENITCLHAYSCASQTIGEALQSNRMSKKDESMQIKFSKKVVHDVVYEKKSDRVCQVLLSEWWPSGIAQRGVQCWGTLLTRHRLGPQQAWSTLKHCPSTLLTRQSHSLF